MRTLNTRRARPLLATAVISLLLAVPCCEGCKEKTGDGKPGGAEARKAVPAAKPPRPTKPRRAGKAFGTTGEELSTITVKAVTGGVTIVPRAGEAGRPAREGDEIRGGGEIAVAADGSATVVIREVGHLSMAPNSTLVVPAHLLCGAVMLDGAGLVAGSARSRRGHHCYLHTPAGALSSPRAKAVVAVAPNGRIRIAATEGTTQIAVPEGDPTEISEGTQLTLDPREGPIRPEPFVRDAGPVERVFDEWRAGQPHGGDSAVRQALDELDGLAKRLDADARRLTGLQASHSETRSKRRKLSFKPDASADETGDLNGQLAAQAEELEALKDGVALLAGSIMARAELTRRKAPGKDQKRLADLQATLDKLAADMPSLFERRRKPAVKMQEIGRPRPKRPTSGE
jgi:hypothetical protein